MARFFKSNQIVDKSIAAERLRDTKGKTRWLTRTRKRVAGSECGRSEAKPGVAR